MTQSMTALGPSWVRLSFLTQSCPQALYPVGDMGSYYCLLWVEALSLEKTEAG